MKATLSCFLTLALAACVLSAPPALDMPEQVKGEAGDFITVEAKTAGKVVRWVAIDPGLKLFPTHLLKDTKTAVVSGARGRYRLLAYTAAGDEPSEPRVTTVVIGDAPDVKPRPDDPPKPDVPPVPAGELRVVLVEETAERMTKAQLEALGSLKVRQWLDANCAGGKAGWRRWDKDVVLSERELPVMKQLWLDAKKSLNVTPAVVIVKGASGQVHPLPADEAGLLELLKKYGGN